MVTSDMALGIVAEFPLGKYVGHISGDITDQYPSPSRLHASLLSAAAQGTRAHESEGVLSPGDQDVEVLHWLEDNPPVLAMFPETAAQTIDAKAYREMGLLQPKKQGTKKFAKQASRGLALAGPMGWAWETEPPERVMDALRELCPDVPYLGTSESPVRLRLAEFEPTHRIDPEADLLDAGGLDVEIPLSGRTDLLVQVHNALQTAVPTAAKDAAKTNEADLSSPRPGGCLATAKYVPVDRPIEGIRLPWRIAVMLEFAVGAGERSNISNSRIAGKDRVAWCVALHRALIAQLGDGAPALITGMYEGMKRPANRLAIQLIDRNVYLTYPPDEPQAFLLLIPWDALPADVAQLQRALERLRTIRGPLGAVLQVKSAYKTVGVSEFWRESEAGMTRTWTTVPVAVPDTRALMRGKWTLHDAVALSVGLVWKNKLVSEGSPQPVRANVPRGDVHYVALADAALASGLEVLHANRVVRGDLSRFVHRVAEGTNVQPYCATLTLGRLAPERSVVAIGQSRHLGGGLLVPVDVPPEVVSAWRHR